MRLGLPMSDSSHRLLLLHASRASVDPVSEFYLREALELRPVNILDEGVMGDLHEKNWGRAVSRLRDLIAQAAALYGVETALVTCSALGPEQMAAIREGSSIRTIKIDEPMLERAARSFNGAIGLVATFPSTADTSLAWLRHFRPEAKIEVVCDAEALQALLRGEKEEHDRRLLAAAEEMAARGVSGIVLAQVSMARLAAEIRRLTGLEVLESLTSSLAGVRR
jgi:intracellular sulfur oxidation DsrE/DsrF family protein